MHAWELPALSSRLGTSGKEGRQDERLPRVTQTFVLPLFRPNPGIQEAQLLLGDRATRKHAEDS